MKKIELMKERKKRHQSIILKRHRKSLKTYLTKNVGLFNSINDIFIDETHHIGKFDEICPFCESVSFTEENPNMCCSNGNVFIDEIKPYPQVFQNLLDTNADFKRFIASYNNLFCFTSLGANIDNSVNDGHSPYIFRVQGPMYHRIGTINIENNNDDNAKYLQIYLLSPEDQVTMRMNNIQDYGYGNMIDKNIIRDLTLKLNH